MTPSKVRSQRAPSVTCNSLGGALRTNLQACVVNSDGQQLSAFHISSTSHLRTFTRSSRGLNLHASALDYTLPPPPPRLIRG